jgi:high-affinity nickel-transport protein
MYPLGILFGLGFDTSSEVALLGISSVEAAKGSSFWVILILPALFTAGMCLLDTIDGALMFSLYIQPSANFLPQKRDSTVSDNSSDTPEDELPQSHDNHRDPIAFLYYSIVLTTLTVIVAIVIGVIQLLTMILNVTGATGKFWDGVQIAGDYYDVIGGAICGCFIIFGGLSVLLYKPWRRWMARRHGQSVVNDEERYPDDSPDSGDRARVFVQPGSSVEHGQTEVVGKGTSQVAVKAIEEPRIEDRII